VGAAGGLLSNLALGQPAAQAVPATPRALDAPSAAEVPALLERGRAALRAGDRYEALAAFARARRLQPDDPEIARALADVLVELGAPSAAAGVLGERTDLGLQSRVAGERLRWATQIPPRSPDPKRRFDDIDPALAQLDALLAQAQAASPVDPGLVTRLQRDRAVALRQRERWQDAVDQVQVLRAAGDALPVYVLQAEADSLLALRRPADARRVYEEALGRMSSAERADEDGPWRQLMKGRAYAEEESEDFDAAFATVEALVAEAGAPWRSAGPLQTPQSSDAWLDAQSLRISMNSYADMPAEAWARLAPLANAAPALAWLRVQSADIAAQRGWPRRAEDDVDIAAALAHEDFGVRIAQVDSDTRRHRLLRADERLASLLEQGADMPEVQRVRRELDAEMGPSVRVDLGARHVENQALRGPGDGGEQGLRVESSTFDGVWRLVGFGDNSTDSLPEGHAERRRLGGGVLARWPDWKLQALGWSQAGSLDTSGGSLSVQWEPTDHWTLMADHARHTPEAPLRADFHGISADASRGGVRYAWNESAEASAQAQNMDFSDGNQRRQLTLDGTLKVLVRPHLDFALEPHVEWQRNSLTGTPYFNPRESVLATLEAKIEHVIWRAYERSLVQRFQVSVGAFDQQDFGSHAVGGVGYEQSWRHDPWTELTWGLQWASNVYDSQRERSLRGYLTFIHKFGR
jgi:poly-beta-1,6 N-acetyl-D-glucosamine export porin PgaA